MTAPPRPAEVLVVGAGLAGLACAGDLLAAGVDVRLVEASDGVGGRMRADRHEGFTIDRGFQVFNTSYPQVKRRLNLRELRLRPFTPGVRVHTGGRPLRVTDPTRDPRGGAALLASRAIGPRDLAAFAALSARDALAPARLVKRFPDGIGGEVTTRTALAVAGFSEEWVELFFRPFLSGVFLEDRLETSGRFFHLVWRSMLRGTLCLPAGGIGAVPRQLAADLPDGVLRLETPVDRLTGDGALLTDGTELPARAVVVAAGPETSARLLPGLAVPAYRTVTTYYHAAGRPPLDEPVLVTDHRLRFLNSCVLSRVVPGYAPAGQALVATSVLGTDTAGREPEVRAALAEAYGTDTGGWQVLTVRTVAGALPAMEPPQPLSRSTRVAPARYACGDHRATGSVQGALASGARAAREVLRDLRMPGARPGH
ncbi:FAD-dependent oxidoreductase [Streptomyces sp. LP05-1]|uniref:FAD-dependent oxidoreductase n=1 Tax=Streptomyces pyxinae TaxID=2970734 RepID=A0ABT2CFZ7_9ACTN|nr:NAD(P)/FAD-dependent oxidoreductase [Streptomyces sp. LP05-1]MCS0636343.1 FAD-dependent oxidoreductase [Streptomyces sp. LP05-1]